MARKLDPARPLDHEIRRVVRRRLRKAAAKLRDAIETTPDRPPIVVDAVHTARRHCKEVRALLRLVDLDRDSGRRLDRAVRGASRVLSPVRDAHVADAIAARTRPFAAAQSDTRASADVPDDHRTAITDAIAQLEAALGLVDELRFDDPTDRLRRGLQRTYGRSRRTYRRASHRPTPHRLHRWRSWNKRLWYQTRFLAVAAPSVLAPRAELLDVVGETLGVVHDLDVHDLGDEQLGVRALEAQGLDAAAAREQVTAQRTALVEPVLRWGATLHAERPAAFAERMLRLWTIAVEQGPEPNR